jgi:diguanylate cyclase (GGDEF)-like protein
VLGRLGGDEFTALAAVDPEGGVERLISRLQDRFDNYNALKLVPYRLSISIGVVQRDSDGTQSMEDLMALADLAMYENKRTKQTPLRLAETEVNQSNVAVA